MGPLAKFKTALRHGLLSSSGNKNENENKPQRTTRLKKLPWGKNQKQNKVESNSKDIHEPPSSKTANGQTTQKPLNNTTPPPHQPPKQKTKQPPSPLPPALHHLQTLGYDTRPSRLTPQIPTLILLSATNNWPDILSHFLAPPLLSSLPNPQQTLNEALFTASKRPNVAVITILLDAGADVHFKGPPLQRTALHNAARVGCKESVELLLERGANIRCLDGEGKTALHLAGEEGEEGVFLLMHLRLFGHLGNVRREDGWYDDEKRKRVRELPEGPQGRLGAYEYPLPGGPADPRPMRWHPVVFC